MAGIDTSTIKAKSGGNLTITDDNDNETLILEETASAVNEITIKNAATGNNPSIKCTGEADTGITFANSENEEILILDSVASSVNEVTIASAATGNGPTISATGETNVDLNLAAKGSGTVNVTSDMKITGTTPTLTIGDAGAEDTSIVFDGNAKDFYVGLDDTADKLVIGEGSTVGTNSILTMTDDTVTIGDGAAVDTYLNFDGNAQDFRIGIDDGNDELEIGHGVAHGTNTAISINSSGQVATLNLPAAAVAVADDHIVILDGGATGAPKAESIQDLLSAIAGSGLSVSGNQLTATGGGTADAVAADNISAGDDNISITGGSGHTLTLNATGAQAQLKTTTSGEVDITSAANVDINAVTGVAIDGTTISIDGTDDSNLTVTASGKDLDIAVAGGGSQELRLASAGTGAAAIHLNASAGGIDIDSADMIDIDAADEITIDTTSADGHIAITSAHTAGDAILISANANAGSILDIDAGILDIDIQAEATIDAVGVAIGAGSGELDLTTTGTLDVNANALDMDLTDSSSITITSSEAAEDLTIEQVGANDSSIIIQAAGTGSDAIHLNATAGSIDIDSADNITIDASDDIAITTGTADGLITIHSAHTTGQAILIDANANAGSILDVDAGILDMDLQGEGTITAGGLFKTEAAGVEIENGSSTGAPALLLDNNDTGQIALDIDAANIDANVIDVTADAVTTANIIDVTADALTTGKILNLVSDSSTTDNRALTAIINENTEATGTMAMAIRNDAILAAGRATVQIKDTAANTAPTLKLLQENNSASGPILLLENDRGGSNNGADDDTCGTIEFKGTDDASNQTIFAKITAEIADASNGAEGGRLLLGVATHDGEFQNGLVLEDGNAEDEIDVIIGNGTSSVTTIAGILDLGDRNITNVGVLEADTIQSDADGTGLNINFDGNTTTNKITLKDNLAEALTIEEGGNDYMQFVTTDGSEKIIIPDARVFAFGSDADWQMYYDEASKDALTITGADMNISSAVSAKPELQIRNTNNDATCGTIAFAKDPGDSSEADGDQLGSISFSGNNDSNAATIYGSIVCKSTDVSASDEAGQIDFTVQRASSDVAMLSINGDISESQFLYDVGLKTDGAKIKAGADGDVVLQHVADTGLLLTQGGSGTAAYLQIRDSAISIGSSADGKMDIDADSEIEIVAPTVDIDASTALTIDGPSTKITSAGTTADALEIEVTALTSGNALFIDADSSITAAVTYVAAHIDLDKNGNTAASTTQNWTGLHIDLNDKADVNTDNSNCIVNMKGQVIDVITDQDPNNSVLTNYGLIITAAGGDKNYGLDITASEGIRLHDGANESPNGHADIRVGNAGEMTIETKDDSASNANLIFKVDGEIMMETASTSFGAGWDDNVASQPIIQTAKVNNEFVTTVVVDIGGGGIVTSGVSGDVIGNNGDASAYLFRLDKASHGLITKVEMICLETPAGASNVSDLDLFFHASDLAEDADVASAGHRIIDGGAWTEYNTVESTMSEIVNAAGGHNDYVYIGVGAGTTGAGTYNAGKFAIKFYGYKF